MKKQLLLIIGFITLLGCEQDTICVDTTTPNMVIRFYDFEDRTEIKTIELDSIWAKGKDAYVKNVKIDTISIPLDLNENFTLYNFSQNSILDSINFNYTRKDIFVGRSCGYKTIYENLAVKNNSTNWIKEIEIINTTIDNDTTAQVIIFY